MSEKNHLTSNFHMTCEENVSNTLFKMGSKQAESERAIVKERAAAIFPSKLILCIFHFLRPRMQLKINVRKTLVYRILSSQWEI